MPGEEKDWFSVLDQLTNFFVFVGERSMNTGRDFGRMPRRPGEKLSHPRPCLSRYLFILI